MKSSSFFSRPQLTALVVVALFTHSRALRSAPALLEVIDAGPSESTSTVEIRGVSAGPFDAKLWQENRLNWVTDVRRPLLAPREGPWRNIYAPSCVATAEGWTLFYGGWDGAPTGNDRIYSTTTTDFLTFGPRSTVIEHGAFHHVCNVNALAAPGGGFEMVCTSYPDSLGWNKPALFRSRDGLTWNGSPVPHAARRDDIVPLAGYDRYEDADINGMNVILREGTDLRLYFSSFRDFGRIYRATSADGTSFTLDSTVLEERAMVNDVKKFRTGGTDWYLMGLHRNRGDLRYSLSRDGRTFEPTKTLFESADGEERYIVALGWVMAGEQDEEGRSLLGVLYGAGAVPSLDRNRIFARWLQKRTVFVTEDGTRTAAEHALGPDRQLLETGVSEPQAGRLELYAEDGRTLLARSALRTFSPGLAYSIRLRR